MWAGLVAAAFKLRPLENGDNRACGVLGSKKAVVRRFGVRVTRKQTWFCDGFLRKVRVFVRKVHASGRNIRTGMGNARAGMGNIMGGRGNAREGIGDSIEERANPREGVPNP